MYCAYVTRIHNLRKHTNADRLLCGECFGNTVIVDLGTDPDQLGVYFPTDGKLGLEFAQKNDLLRRRYPGEPQQCSGCYESVPDQCGKLGGLK